MEINYLEQHQNFNGVLEKGLDRMLTGKIESIEIKNIPSSVFCEATGCRSYDYNGWQCDWWGKFEYKGHQFKVGGCAWYGEIGVNLE